SELPAMPSRRMLGRPSRSVRTIWQIAISLQGAGRPPRQEQPFSFKEEANMSELRYPNESREYRDARDSLLKDEQELIEKIKSVAERRRNLPPGGQLKEEYVFQWT